MPISEQRGRRPSPSGAAVATPVHSRLTVLSGPSGVGKSTVVAELSRTCPQIWISVSVTTRRPRPGEVDGREYYFVDDDEFDRLIASGALLEWARFAGNRYGTPREPLHAKLGVIGGRLAGSEAGDRNADDRSSWTGIRRPRARN